nr:hypothetical protein [Tanacetum cinerariifolium]
DFNKKDLVKNDENDDTTGTTKDKNNLLHSDSKMESDSPASDDGNQKSDDDDGKQYLTFKRSAWRKKSVMDNENKDAKVVELSSSIKRCGHPMKDSYHLDVKDTGNQTVEHNDANEDTGNIDSAFYDIRDEQNNDDSELSNNADGKSENEDEESDALAITICNVCHHVPLQDSESEKEEFDFGGDTDNEEKYDPKKDADYKGEFYKSPYELKPIELKIRVLAFEKLVADTLFAMMYKPRKIVFETYKGFKVLAIKMETLATGLDVHYEVINAWFDVLNTIEKDRKDDDKTARKYCFKTEFLQANFLDKNVDANIKIEKFEKKLKQAVNNDTTLMKLQLIQFDV